MENPKADVTLKVLVCEYKQLNRNVLRNMLQHYGHDVVITASTEEALATFWANPSDFDLLLIDIPVQRQVVVDDNHVVLRVPEISFDWLERIRQTLPALPVLLISGSLGESFVPPAGAQHLPKPFTCQELYVAIHDVVATSWSIHMAEAA